MLIDPNRFKRVAFDSVLMTYSAALIVWALGLSPFMHDKESAIHNMSVILVQLALTFAAAIAINVSLFLLNFDTPGAYLFERPRKPLSRSFSGLYLAVVFVLTVYASLVATDASLRELLDEQGWAGAARLFSDLAHPNWSLLPESVIEVIETIFIAFLGTLVAVPIAFLLAFAAAKNLMRGPVAFTFYLALRTVLNITRSVEPLIWAIIFSVWVGVGPFAGMLALLLHSIASLTKQYSELIEGVSEGPLDAIRSTGARPLQVIWFGVVPQVVLPYIAFTIYRWDINVRMATVIGLVGGGGIGTLLIRYQGQAMWKEVGCIVAVIAVVVWLMDTASAYIREALK